MSNNFHNKMKKIAGAHDRLDSIEKNFSIFASGVDRAVATMRQQFSASMEIINALVELAGVEAVENVVKQRRREAAQADEDRRKDAVVKALESGTLVPEETIRLPSQEDPSGSFITLEEASVTKKENGEQTFSRNDFTFVCLPMSHDKLKDYAEKLKDQKSGFMFELNENTVAFVLSVFKRVKSQQLPVEEKQESPPAESQAEKQSEVK